LGLTAHGRRLDVDAEGTVESAVERTLGQISHPQLQAARKVLGTLVTALEEECSPPKDPGKRPATSAG
jgi:hypothetical protein